MDKSEISVEVYPKNPEGGMHVGRVPSGVRIIHNKSNISVCCESHRSQHKNKEQALYHLKLIIEIVEDLL
jgi:peptide chain release factor 2